MKYPKVEIETLTFEASRYVRGKNIWMATTLAQAVKDQQCVLFDYPLCTFNLTSTPFDLSDMGEFIYQMKRCENTDLSYPIILDDTGQVADGYHRICKAIMNGLTSLPAYRLKYMPEPDLIE